MGKATVFDAFGWRVTQHIGNQWHFICWKQNIFGLTFFGLSAQHKLSASQLDDIMQTIYEKGGRIRPTTFLTDFKTFLGQAWSTFLICARFLFHASPLSLPLWLTYEVRGNTSQLTFCHNFKRQSRSYKVSGFWPFVRECFFAFYIGFGMFSQRHFVDIPG